MQNSCKMNVAGTTPTRPGISVTVFSFPSFHFPDRFLQAKQACMEACASCWYAHVGCSPQQLPTLQIGIFGLSSFFLCCSDGTHEAVEQDRHRDLRTDDFFLDIV